MKFTREGVLSVQYKENETAELLEKEKKLITDKDYEYSKINHKEIEDNKYLVDNKLITNGYKGNLLNELKRCLSECERFYFSVAFINFSGLQLLLDAFKELEEKGVKGRIITSTYLNFTEPKALKRIKEFSNIDLKIFVADKEKGFHTKAYIFENRDEYKIIIGSSNITQRALKSNVEWNVKVISKKEDKFVLEVIEEYLELWDSTSFVDEEFLTNYNNFITEIRKTEHRKNLDFTDYEIIRPNSMQNRAINNLNRIRELGEDRALVVAATGERVIIVTGCINALRSRVSGTLVNMIHALLRVIKYNYCKQCMRSKDVLALQY